MTDMVFLFGHRQQHGKNTVTGILETYFKEKNINYISTYFAKKLKKICSEKYCLDFSKMEDNEYKLSCPSHLKEKVIFWDVDSKREVPHWVFMNPDKLHIEQRITRRTVRDVLLEEGQSARAIWNDTWAKVTYDEILGASAKVAIVSDFRYPNEYDFAVDNKIPCRVIKVLVHRPDGIFKSDGADNLLPDVNEKYWDHVIINPNVPNWLEIIKTQTLTLARNYGL